MDVDNDSIDPNLLLQFTCLNTTDRDDLIKQFKELIEKVDDEKAEFFLEMNNWNLQNAICSFFDFLSPSDLSMAVVQQPPGSDNLTPNIDCTLMYTIRNDGRATWPRGCFLSWWSGNFRCDKTFPVDAVQPGCDTSVFLNFTSPSEPGSYTSSFRLMTPSKLFFGKVITFSFQVHAKLEDMEEQSLSDELAARMALMDNTDCKIMEEEPNAEPFDAVPNSLNNSIGMDQWNVSDFNRRDRNIS